MALTVGTPVAASTTLGAFIDLVYANKTAALTGASAVITPLELNRLVVSWPGYNDLIHIVLQARPLPPETILYS